MDREDFMNVVYGELASDPDNCRANRIIDAADEYAESVQLGTNLAEVGTDTISRQAAIKALHDEIVRRRISEDTNDNGTLDEFDTEAILRQLPLAQPEPCEDDPRADVYYLAEKIGIHQLYELVVKLHGESEPCEDAVSRKAVQYLLAHFVDEDKYVDACDGLKHLPPVTPKQRTGHWIPVGMAEAVGGESAQWGSAVAYHKCSECDEQALRDDFEQEVLSEFCPHCGAKMVGVCE